MLTIRSASRLAGYCAGGRRVRRERAVQRTDITKILIASTPATGHLNPHQIDLVQSSFAKVVPIADAAAKLFYARLFEIAPSVKPLFHGDMAEQGRKLTATLGVVVNGLKNLEAIVPAAQALAVKHVAYGVKAADYAPVGEALLWTLQQGLGEAYTAEVASAWTIAYRTLSGVMIAAAYGEEAAA